MLSIINKNDTSKANAARRDMEGFYACQLNRNEERFLIAAFGVTNASTSDLGSATVGKSTYFHKNNMRSSGGSGFPRWKRQPPQGRPTYYLTNFLFRKLHENEDILPQPPPPDPPMRRQHCPFTFRVTSTSLILIFRCENGGCRETGCSCSCF